MICSTVASIQKISIQSFDKEVIALWQVAKFSLFDEEPLLCQMGMLAVIYLELLAGHLAVKARFAMGPS